MKKLFALIIAIVMVIGCLTACGGAKEATTAAPEVTTEASESEVSEDFAAFLQAIYDAEPGTAGASEKVPAAAKAFVDYVFAADESLNNEMIASATFTWLEEKSADNPGFVDAFEEAFMAVLDEVFDMDESYAEDVTILKFSNGILSAIEGDLYDDDEEYVEELDEEFTAFLDAIYAAEPGTAGASEKVPAAAKAFLDYVSQYSDVTVSEISYGTELYLEEKAETSGSFAGNFQESFDAVVEELNNDESLETDVTVQQYINGIQDGIDTFMSID